MKQALALGVIIAVSLPEAQGHTSGCAKSSVAHMADRHRSLGMPFDALSYVPPSKTSSASPYPLLSVDELPARHDWRSINGTNFVTFANAQLLPNLCGSCWGQSSLGSLSDRYKIALEAKLPDIQLSVQSLIDCGTKAGTCNGGSPLLAYQFLDQSDGVPDITCSPYRGVDNSNWSTEIACEDRQCRHCDRFGTCSWVAASDTRLRYKVSEYGAVFGVEHMMNEIYHRGPITCLMYAHSDSFEDYEGGVITDTTQYDGTTHAVAVVGWGETEDGVKYWSVRNSFGTNWGENGFYRVLRGADVYNMESNECAWATPHPETVELLKKIMPL